MSFVAIARHWPLLSNFDRCPIGRIYPNGEQLPRWELVACRDCHHQVRVTAGTVFYRRRSALWKWFRAACQIAQDDKRIPAWELVRQIRVSYTPAWLMLHELRRAMRRRNG